MIDLSQHTPMMQHQLSLMPAGVGDKPLMTVAQHNRILAATVPSNAEAIAWRVTGRGGITVTGQYPEWAEDDCLLTITPLYTNPAATVPAGSRVVPVELLQRVVDYYWGGDGDMKCIAQDCCDLLAKSEGVKK